MQVNLNRSIIISLMDISRNVFFSDKMFDFCKCIHNYISSGS